MSACVRQIVLEYVLMDHLMHKIAINLFHRHIRGLTIDDNSVEQSMADINLDPFSMKQPYLGAATLPHNEFHRLELVRIPNPRVDQSLNPEGMSLPQISNGQFHIFQYSTWVLIAMPGFLQHLH